MSAAENEQWSAFQLLLPPPGAAGPKRMGRDGGSLSGGLLLRNVQWFCRLRWAVVGILAAFNLLCLAPPLQSFLGVRTGVYLWPAATAAVLALANLGFLLHARSLCAASRTERPEPAGDADAEDVGDPARRNLAAQIVLDLLVLTVVVHYLGSVETYAAFAYLFHIVLACIFFAPRASLAVLAASGLLYAGCVTLEETGLVPPASVYPLPALREQITHGPGGAMVHVGAAIAIWTVVWYLTSHLSLMVRRRDAELAEANVRLLDLHRRKAGDMLRMTHELKAPFAAIYACVQLLCKGYCGPFPDAARDVLDRIAARCRRLGDEIQEMLQLANLRPGEEPSLSWAEMDLADVLDECIGRLMPLAEQRNIAVRKNLAHARLVGIEDHVKMLLANLLANAIHYSHPGGEVRVTCAQANGSGPKVTIEDDGIGIAAEKLPHIFEDYYRTEEAVRHNKESSGLGLAIVRRVAETHGYGVTVRSAPGVGTTFSVSFPSGAAMSASDGCQKGERDALRVDR